jgi:hypothetical protein
VRLRDPARTDATDLDRDTISVHLQHATGTNLMRTKITAVDVHDVRFPTAAVGDGSDAMNRGDYSASYVELRTGSGPTVAGLTFTNGRGNEITCAAVRALADHVVGRTVEEIFDEPVAFWRSLTAGCYASSNASPFIAVVAITSKDDGQAGIPAERLDIRIPIPSFAAVV